MVLHNVVTIVLAVISKMATRSISILIKLNGTPSYALIMAYETDGSAANTTATSEGHVRSLPLCSGYLKPDAPGDGVHLQRSAFPNAAAVDEFVGAHGRSTIGRPQRMLHCVGHRCIISSSNGLCT